MTGHGEVCRPPARRAGNPLGRRRGVLLLVVLCALTLFMLLGIAFVTMSARTRATARAVAEAAQTNDDAILPTGRLLDQAAMLLIRGPKKTDDGQPINPPPQPLGDTNAREQSLVFESLLEDQYGGDVPPNPTPEDRLKSPLKATLVEIVDGGPVCLISATTKPDAQYAPAELSGRILSLLPVGAPATSHRILRAEAGDDGGLRFCVSHMGAQFPRSPDGRRYVLPAAGTDVIISSRGQGRKDASGFKNECWDGFDEANPFLAHVEPDPAQPSRQVLIRPSMFKIEAAVALNDLTANHDHDGDQVDDRADNDNDGVFDGWFFDPKLPEIVSPRTGRPVSVHMSCLILDMDGRLNVNAHGSVYDLAPGLLRQKETLPFGSGVGPGEIDGGTVFRWLAGASGNTSTDNPWMNLMLGGRAGSTLRDGSGGPRTGDHLVPLYFPEGAAVEGRYGWKANALALPLDGGLDGLENRVPRPGFNDVADPAAFDGIRDLAAVPMDRRGWAVDLNGGLQREAEATAAPVPTYFYSRADSGAVLYDHPYEIGLDERQRRTGLHDPATGGVAVSGVADNPFSPAELERVLRPYDSDSPTLPERLAALLGSQAEAARMVVTTDSWDTGGIVGEAAERVYGWFSAVPPGVLHEHAATDEWDDMIEGRTCPNNLMPFEFAAGLRMDVTRPVGTAGERQMFFKDLYMAAVALSAAERENPSADVARQCGQWAANVIECQDADSTMTRFEYDVHPLDGWQVDGDPSTVEPDSGTVWGAERPEVVITETLAWEDGVTGELFVALHHPWDARLGNGPAGSAEPVDPALAGPDGPGSVDMGLRAGSDAIWRIRIRGGDTFALPEQGTCLEANTWLFVRPQEPSTKGIRIPDASATRHVADISGLRARLPAQQPPDSLGGRSTLLYLERLADPRTAHDTAANPYLIVDALSVFVADRSKDRDANSNPNPDPNANPGPAPPQNPNQDANPDPNDDPNEDEEEKPDERYTACRRNSGWAQQHDEMPFAKGQTPELKAEWAGGPRWLVWPNRPLTSPTELVFVPGFISFQVYDETNADDKGMLADHVADPDDGIYLPDRIPGDKLVALEVFTVPSRFAGTRQSVDRTAAYWEALKRLRVGFYGGPTSAYRGPSAHCELAAGREPGRVNLNTITSDAVWEAVVQGTVPRIAAENPAQPPYGLVRGRTSGRDATTPRFAELASTGTTGTVHPAKTTGQLLSLSGVNDRPTLVLNGANAIPDAAINPAHSFYTATRLGNIATNRSHVFAIWITLRTMEQTGERTTSDDKPVIDRETVAFHRMFLLFDRSQPLAFEPGRDHNVRDGIVLRRVLQ